jgi:serine/threonine protein kinase
MKLRMIISLVSGLNYLHHHGIVHLELKPSDLIVQEDFSLRISDYATSTFEDHGFARASQVGGPSYMAPEIYDDEEDGRRWHDPKTDVFSFGLILYELITGQKVFPATLSAALIMRRAMSNRPRDRPGIPHDINPVLREMITRSWVPNVRLRPTFEIYWKQMREISFKLFPDVHVSVHPATLDRVSTPMHE